MANRSFFRRPAVLLLLALVTVGGVVTLLGRLATGPRLEAKRVPLATDAGAKAYPVFSPDGQRLAYSARGAAQGEAFHIYVRTVAPDTPRALTGGKGNDLSPVWSPDGARIAFLRLEDGRAQYLVVPADGGTERKVVDFPSPAGEEQAPPSVAWTPDGKGLIVVIAGQEPPALGVAPVEGGAAVAITTPPADSPGDSTPAVSPDGQTLAFVRGTSEEGADIWASDLRGRGLRRVTYDDKAIQGISWTRDGQELIYSSTRQRLWRVASSGGAARELTIAGREAQYPSASPAGNRLVFANNPGVTAIWRAGLGSSAQAAPQPILRSTGQESWPVYSPDGQKIANVSDQSGEEEIWLAGADGSNRVQISHLQQQQPARLAWSPDGRMLAFDASDRGRGVFTIAAAAGAKAKRVVMNGGTPAWSRDGKSIYYLSRGQIWKAAADGANPEVLVSLRGATAPAASPDGKWLYFRYRQSFWRVPAAGGEPEEAFVPENDQVWGGATITQKGIYYPELERKTHSWVVSFYDWATRQSSVAYRMEQSGKLVQAFSVSPDGKSLLFPRADESQTNLILIENFK